MHDGPCGARLSTGGHCNSPAMRHCTHQTIEIHRWTQLVVLEPGGLLVASVPAHQWLFSDFDKSIGHFRRYSRKEIVNTLEDSGFLNNLTQFIFSFLVLPAFVLRTVPSKFGRKHTSAETKETTRNQQKMLKLLQPILGLLLILENFLRIPFGLSLISVSKKPSNNA